MEPQIGHAEIASFADRVVNLPQNEAKKFRDQANRLQEKLVAYLQEDEDFSLRKILKSGSLAKRTALRDLNDIDMACYIAGVENREDVSALIKLLTEKLRTAFPNFSHDQVEPQRFSVKVSFRGTGLDIDVVPIIYDGDENWYGMLVNQVDGSLIETCIPRHLEFCQKRKNRHPRDFAQVVRLLKYWVSNAKENDPEFRFKSFMVEMIMSHLSDNDHSFSNYPEALQTFFTYVIRHQLSEIILFSDYHREEDFVVPSNRVRIMDPVTLDNNVGKDYSEQDVARIVDAATEAGDAIDAAYFAPTKSEATRYWRKVFGSSFSLEGT